MKVNAHHRPHQGYFLPPLKSSCHAQLTLQHPEQTKKIQTAFKQLYSKETLTQESKENFDRSVQSIKSLLEQSPPKVQRHYADREKPDPKKIKIHNAEEKRDLSLQEAEKVFRNQHSQPEQRSKACKIIAQSYLRKVYGSELPNIQKESTHFFQQNTLKNKLNTKILSQILSQIQHNSRSHSILIRKSQLEQLQVEYFRGKQTTNKQSKFRVSKISSEQQRIQTIYKLKNQYQVLKELIISTKSQEYDVFLAKIALQNSNDLKRTQRTMKESGFKKKTFVLTGIDKENVMFLDAPSAKSIEYPQPTKPRKNNSINFSSRKFQHSGDRLFLQNLTDISPKIFLFLVSSLRFDSLRSIRLKYLWIQSQLIYFFLDCLHCIGYATTTLQLFEFSSIKVENLAKMAQQLAKLSELVPIRELKLQSLELTNREIAKVCEGLACNKLVEEISFRHNKIDILGLRHIEALSRNNKNIKFIDLRNNQIPHYANLKDKSRVIQFF